MIDLNCDVGEMSREIDDAMLPWVTSCNVCCGAHAGNAELIEGTIREAIRIGVAVGAHPSWPDRKNFGRQSMNLPIETLRTSLLKQIGFVKQLAETLGGKLQHVKPHGALYHDVQQDDRLAEMLVEVVASIDSKLQIYGLAESAFAQVCTRRQIKFVHEAFGDRRYESKNALRSRSHGDALLSDETDFRNQIGGLLRGEIIDVHGQPHDLNVQTICLHSDTPNAVKFVKTAYEIIHQNN